MRTRDVRVEGYRPLIPPAVLLDELPLPEEGSRAIAAWRDEITSILERSDDRLIVVVGPCSVHDVRAGLEYARRLHGIVEELSADLRIVMRVYFEKPRTTVGWKGLINDPRLDGSFQINEGLRLARKLLLDVVALGLPAGCEFLDPISPQYTSDLVSWGAIGARTTESQVHRELASGLSMPIGFKNGTGGTTQIAIDAVRAAAYPHRFLGVTEQGLASIVITKGNPECHVILRGGARGPNYDRASIATVMKELGASGVAQRVMVDASHGNSERDHQRQADVARDIASQIASGERGIVGVMLESFLLAGRQELKKDIELEFGKSITDACMSWDESAQVLRDLAAAVRERRGAQTPTGRVASTSR
ncbi:MAG TPA: 3-deoxy-7-phosphoheptulonate synthase [Candidatus Limnocylindria bacterium]|jgi:3-deoxy-7-phosphoheptulonate synthase